MTADVHSDTTNSAIVNIPAMAVEKLPGDSTCWARNAGCCLIPEQQARWLSNLTSVRRNTGVEARAYAGLHAGV